MCQSAVVTHVTIKKNWFYCWKQVSLQTEAPQTFSDTSCFICSVWAEDCSLRYLNGRNTDPIIPAYLVRQEYLLQCCLQIHHPSAFFSKDAEILVLLVQEYDNFKFVDSYITIKFCFFLKVCRKCVKKVCNRMYSGNFLGCKLGSGSGHTAMCKRMYTFVVARLTSPYLRDVSTDAYFVHACEESRFHLEWISLWDHFFPTLLCNHQSLPPPLTNICVTLYVKTRLCSSCW